MQEGVSNFVLHVDYFLGVALNRPLHEGLFKYKEGLDEQFGFLSFHYLLLCGQRSQAKVDSCDVESLQRC